MKIHDEELKREAQNLLAQGYPKITVAKRIGVSRPTLEKMIKDSQNSESEMTEAISPALDINMFVEYHREAARTLKKLLKNKYYGNILEEVYAEYGITLTPGIFTSAIELVNRYPEAKYPEDFDTIASFVFALLSLGFEPDQLTDDQVEVFRTLSRVSNNDAKFILDHPEIFVLFRNFISQLSPHIDAVAKVDNISRPAAVRSLFQTKISEWKDGTNTQGRIAKAELSLNELDMKISEKEGTLTVIQDYIAKKQRMVVDLDRQIADRTDEIQKWNEKIKEFSRKEAKLKENLSKLRVDMERDFRVVDIDEDKITNENSPVLKGSVFNRTRGKLQ